MAWRNQIFLAFLFCTALAAYKIYYQPLTVEAERVNMERVVKLLHMAVQNEYARRATRDSKQMQALAESNPIKLLSEPPSNYLGEFEKDPGSVKPGHWYYVKPNATLMYQVLATDHFRSASKGMVRARFKIKIHENRSQDDPVVVIFTPLESYTWK